MDYLLLSKQVGYKDSILTEIQRKNIGYLIVSRLVALNMFS